MRVHPRHVAFALLGAAALAVTGPTGAQTIHQRVEVIYTPLGGSIAAAQDETSGNSPGDLRDILADLRGPRYEGRAAAGTFGDVGTSVGLLTSFGQFHTIAATTEILGDPVFVNPLGIPVRVSSDFIIDGGRLWVIGGEGSFASFRMELYRGTPLGGVTDLRFTTSGRLQVDANGDAAFAAAGADIGAGMDGSNSVRIPLSFQTADLGILGPGEALSLFYTLGVTAGTGQFGEIVRAEFSDPFDVSGSGILGTIRFAPAVPAVVPEPNTLALLGGGALLLLGVARRRRGR